MYGVRELWVSMKSGNQRSAQSQRIRDLPGYRELGNYIESGIRGQHGVRESEVNMKLGNQGSHRVRELIICAFFIESENQGSARSLKIRDLHGVRNLLGVKQSGILLVFWESSQESACDRGMRTRIRPHDEITVKFKWAEQSSHRQKQ